MSALDLTGMTFGRLTAKYKVGTLWVCSCLCGVTKTYRRSNLVYGGTKSCGCLKKELLVSTKTTHGKTKTGEYHSWFAMIQRCTNPKHPYYHRYGGRGIQVCPRWSSFDLFYEDMGDKPSPKHSLDRFPDNNGEYGPTNCRWGTIEEQSNNKSTTILLTFNGKTQSAAQWAVEVGINKSTVYNRIRLGWDTCRILQKC